LQIHIAKPANDSRIRRFFAVRTACGHREASGRFAKPRHMAANGVDLPLRTCKISSARALNLRNFRFREGAT
jgi:hypothetical protein